MSSRERPRWGISVGRCRFSLESSHAICARAGRTKVPPDGKAANELVIRISSPERKVRMTVKEIAQPVFETRARRIFETQIIAAGIGCNPHHVLAEISNPYRVDLCAQHFEPRDELCDDIVIEVLGVRMGGTVARRAETESEPVAYSSSNERGCLAEDQLFEKSSAFGIVRRAQKESQRRVHLSRQSYSLA